MNRRRALAAIATYPFLTQLVGATPVERMGAYRREIMSGRTRSGVIACDSFDRADSTDLGSTNNLPFLPGRPGVTWTEVAGNWEINGRRIGSQGSSPGGQGWLATVDIGVSDYTLEWTLAYTPNANSHSILVGYVAGTSFIRLQHTQTPAVLSWLRVTSGTGTSIGSPSTGVTPTLGDRVSVRKVGAAYSAWITRAGAVVGTAATIASETQGQSSTVVGLRASAASVLWTNFCALRAE